MNRSAPEAVGAPDKAARTTRCTVTEAHGSQWLLYAREVTVEVDRGQDRPERDTALISVAFPRGRQQTGFVHVGLPVRTIGLPFRICAPFDPLANRRDLADTELNQILIRETSKLWCDAGLDMFAHSAADAWAAVPLSSELADDQRTTGRFREALIEHLLLTARTRLAAALTFPTAGGKSTPIDAIAIEHRDLTGLLTAADIAELTDGHVLLPKDCRDTHDRWRAVLAELSTIGAASPATVDVDDALRLLATTGRHPELMAGPTAIALNHGLAPELKNLLCIATAQGAMRPSDLDATRMLTDETAEPIWASLGLGIDVDPTYQASPGWAEVKTWLLDDHRYSPDAGSAAALTRLSNAGTAGHELPATLSDAQILELRSAIESLNEDARRRVGPGIGRAVTVDATTYDVHGQPTKTTAHPSSAYLIEKEPDAWSIAAGRTPGLTWVHRRYTDVLKSPAGGRSTGVAAQRLFRLLGAESAPRVIPNPNTEERLGTHAVPRSNVSSAAQTLMRNLDADYLLRDTISPDLQAVLINIAAEQSGDIRQRRANAVLASLTRAWDRLLPTAQAMNAHYTWHRRGDMPASWVLQARASRWLARSDGAVRAPSELAIKTPGAMAMLGSDPALFLHPVHDRALWHDTLLELGVRGDPAASDLVDQLIALRARDLPARDAVENASPLYEALASHVTSGNAGIGDLPQRVAVEAFKSGSGLIATEAGWLRPNQVLDGPPIFGDQRIFVPAITGGTRLWRAIGVPKPRAEDAEGVIRELARKKTLSNKHRMVVIDSLRLLVDIQAENSPTRFGPPRAGLRKELRRLPMWTGTSWTRTRPVFAVSDPQLLNAVAPHMPVWQPGADLHQFDILIPRLALTRITFQDMSVAPGAAVYDDDCTTIFQAAIRILQKDLALNDPEVEQALSLSWDTLADFEVAVDPGLQVHSELPSLRTVPKLAIRAWISTKDKTLYVADTKDAGNAENGGFAVAALFGTTNPRHVAYPWLGAWANATAGVRAEALTIASRKAQEEAAQRTADSEQILQDLQRRSAKQNEKTSGSQTATSKGVGGKNATVATPPPPPAIPPTPRTLVDPSEFQLVDSGSMFAGTKPATPPGAAKPPSGLVPPRPPGSTSPKPATGRGLRAYTDREREDVGMDLVRTVLGYDTIEIQDIRAQHNVGADAVDELQQFYELKVHAGEIPDQIKLTTSEVQRAHATTGFFLVLVGNVERDTGQPEVRIVHDPLNHLRSADSGSITLAGARTAKALIYTFITRPDGSEDDEATAQTDV